MASATAAAITVKISEKATGRVVYPVSLLAALSVWLVALPAPLWVDETLAHWQVSGGLGRIWSRAAQMPSSLGYLYTLWGAKSILGNHEIALRVPSLLAMLGATYLLYRIARELFDRDIAILTCVFFSAHPDVVFAATDARPYAFALLATNLSIYCFLLWMKRKSMEYALLFGASAASILYFHYLFGVILPAFVLGYIALRGRCMRNESRQWTSTAALFLLLAAPLVMRIAVLYQTRQTHVIPHFSFTIIGLRVFALRKILFGFLACVFIAAVLRRVRLPGRESVDAIVLCLLLGLVPAGILCAISMATTTHVFIPRYCLVAAPGAALIWSLLTNWIDSKMLRQAFCLGVTAVSVYAAFTSPVARRHELSFKGAFAMVNASVADDKAPVLLCSAFIESDYGPLPAVHSESALLSQASYYRIDAPTTLLPLDLNQETVRVVRESVTEATSRRQRFLAVAGPQSYPIVEWIAEATRGEFSARVLGKPDEVAVVEFSPIRE